MSIPTSSCTGVLVRMTHPPPLGALEVEAQIGTGEEEGVVVVGVFDREARAV